MEATSTIELAALLLLAIPAAVFAAGEWLMERVSRRRLVHERLAATVKCPDCVPLNQRLRGYSAADAAAHWAPLRDDPAAARAELRFLRLDLAFPVAYGAAFAVALFYAWRGLGYPFAWSWIAIPIAVTVVSDWIENAVQLAQLAAFLDRRQPAAPDRGWIRLASIATQLKLAFFAGISALLLLLVGGVMFCST